MASTARVAASELSQLNKIREHIRAFIDIHSISCPEAIYQNDEVALDAIEFIESVCDLVGYYEEEE